MNNSLHTLTAFLLKATPGLAQFTRDSDVISLYHVLDRSNCSSISSRFLDYNDLVSREIPQIPEEQIVFVLELLSELYYILVNDFCSCCGEYFAADSQEARDALRTNALQKTSAYLQTIMNVIALLKAQGLIPQIETVDLPPLFIEDYKVIFAALVTSHDFAAAEKALAWWEDVISQKKLSILFDIIRYEYLAYHWREAQ